MHKPSKNPFPVPLGTPTIPVEIMCLIQCGEKPITKNQKNKRKNTQKTQDKKRKKITKNETTHTHIHHKLNPF